MRLFVAVDVPESVRPLLAGLQQEIGDSHARIKWVERENLHVTLKFLGEVSEEKAEDVVKALESVSFRPFLTSVAEFGAFPSESRPRVMWAGLKPDGSLNELHGAVDSALEPLGFPRDERFTAHVTLGRVRFVTDGKALSGKLKSMKNVTLGEPFAVGAFSLKKSTLTKDGPEYEDVKTFSVS